MIQADMHMHTWFQRIPKPVHAIWRMSSQKRVENHLLTDHLTRMIWNGEKKVSLMWMLILWKCRNFRKNMQETEYQDWNRTGT